MKKTINNSRLFKSVWIMMLLGALQLAPLQAIAKAEDTRPPLRIATEASYPPFSEVDANGQLIGFDIDIAHAICEELDRPCQITNMSWDGLVPALLSRKYDLIIASMSITVERKRRLAFSMPYYKNGVRFVGQKSLKNNPIEDKTVKRIGVLKASAQEFFLQSYLEKNFPKASIVRYDDNQQLVLEMKSDRISVGLFEAITADRVIKDASEHFKLLSEELFDAKALDEGIAIATRKGNEKLINKVNQALLAIRRKGIYQAISKRYFDRDIFPVQTEAR